MSWEKGEARRERRPNQGHAHGDQTKAAQESCILYAGHLPYWDPYFGPSTLSPVFLVCEKHLLLYPPEPVFKFLFSSRQCST